MSGVVPVIEGIIDLIDKNLVAKTNVVSDALTGDVLVNVENSFHFVPDQEIVLIDYDYNVEGTPHYDNFEYAVIKEVNNTHWITLTSPIIDPAGGWLVSKGAFIQKTIEHSPLYSDKIYYGDREVIPTEEMAVTVEPQSLSNEWMYIHGGLSEEYRVGIMIYGKDINTEQGMKILNAYTDAMYDIFNRSIHIDIDNYDTPLLSNVAAGTTTIIVEDTSDNRTNFQLSSLSNFATTYQIQDNIGIETDLWITNISTPGDGNMYITVNLADPITWGVRPLNRAYSIAEYGVFTKHGRYFYDSRIDNIEYGMVQKGSAFLRAARLNWFGKEITEYRFPQKSLGVDYFPEHSGESSSESDSSSSP